MTKIITGTTALRTTTAAIAALVFVQSGIAQAQDASGGVQSSIADTQDSDENAIIVTARRIEEKLSEVPVTVAAFDSEALAQRQINSEETLQIATPGLTTKQSISSNYLNYAIRGQSVGAFSYSPPAVVTYFNEVPVGGTSATTFFDLSSIQVLKGPQGTLFGRNATGGAVIYQSQLPNSEFEGYLRAGYGNFDNTEIEGAINIPISKHIALRVAGRSHKRDGFQHNLLYDTYANSIDSQVGRISLRISPEDSRFDNVTVFQKGEFGGINGALVLSNAYGAAGAPTTYINPGTGAVTPLNISYGALYGPNALGAGNGSSSNPLVNSRFNGVGDFLLRFHAGQLGGFYDYFANQHEGNIAHDASQTFISNTTTYEVSDELTIKNVFGYNRLFSSDLIDIDGGPYEFISISGGPASNIDGHTYPAEAYVFGTKQWSNELQASGTMGSLSYIVGGFWSNEKNYSYSPISITPDRGAQGVGYLGAYEAAIDDTSKALYAQLSLAVNDRLNITGGFRNTWEDVGIVYPQSSPGAPRLLSGMVPTSEKVTKPSWLISADFKLADNLMVYATHRGSWRTGGFNGTSGIRFPVGDYFKPETTYDFEVGAKFAGYIGSKWAQLNVAIYDQHVKDVQRTIYIVTAVGPAAVAGNVEKARVTGGELDASLKLNDWLTVGGTFAYTNARYTDPRALFGDQQFFFNPYSDTPKITGSAFFVVSKKVGNAGDELNFRGDFYAQSHWYYSNTNDSASPLTGLPGYELVNMRAEWKNIRGSEVSLSAFVTNLLKKEYYVGGQSNGPSGGFNAVMPGRPRMFGMELRVDF